MLISVIVSISVWLLPFTHVELILNLLCLFIFWIFVVSLYRPSVGPVRGGAMGNPLLHSHGNTEHFYIVDTYGMPTPAKMECTWLCKHVTCHTTYRFYVMQLCREFIRIDYGRSYGEGIKVSEHKAHIS
jgi:hypothetical protein